MGIFAVFAGTNQLQLKSIKAFYSILRNVLTSIVDRDVAFLNKQLGSALD
jgi:hypothetical protein